MAAQLSRRNLLAAAAAGGVAACWSGTASAAEPAKKGKVAMVHVTDLFRPFADADDHWDLACTYALRERGDVDLLGIIIDYPPKPEYDPDVQAVAQMNYLAGLSAPVIVGSPRRIDLSEVDRPENKAAIGAVQAIIDILRNASQPVVIHILGSSRDVALAGKLEPKVFAEKCAGVYLNAGSGTPDKTLAARLEYNVASTPSLMRRFSSCRVRSIGCRASRLCRVRRIRRSRSRSTGLITGFSRKKSCRGFPRGSELLCVHVQARFSRTRAVKRAAGDIPLQLAALFGRGQRRGASCPTGRAVPQHVVYRRFPPCCRLWR